MNIRLTILVASMTILTVGCAGYTAKPINNVEEDKISDGVRYYENAPFLLVYSDGKGNLTSQILIMPDLSKKMVLDLYAFASNNSSTLNFENGVLTSSKFVLDSTTVPTSIINTIQTLGVAAMSSAFRTTSLSTTRYIPAPYLFKIVVDSDGTRLVGGQGVGPDGKPLIIQVSVTKEAAAKMQATAPIEKGEEK